MIRPNLASVWLIYDLYIFFKLLRDKELKRLIKIILYSFLGLLIIFIPILLYLYLKNALMDFFSTYIIFNLNYMGAVEYTIERSLTILIEHSGGIIPISVILPITLIYILKLKKEEKTLLITNIIYTIINIYLAVQPQKANIHYLIPITANLIIPISVIFQRMNKKNMFIGFILFLLFIIEIMIVNINVNKTMKKWKDIYGPASKVIQRITKPEDEILQIGNRPAIYLSSNRMYSGKYFFQIPVAYYDEKIEKEFIEELKRIKPKLIIDLVIDWDNIEEHSELGAKFKTDLADFIKKEYNYLGNRFYIRIEDN